MSDLEEADVVRALAGRVFPHIGHRRTQMVIWNISPMNRKIRTGACESLERWRSGSPAARNTFVSYVVECHPGKILVVQETPFNTLGS